MKIFLLISASMLLTYSGISQGKPKDSVVCNSASDLRLIIQSNEAGKKAQEQVPLLKQKVQAQDSLGLLLRVRLQTKDSTIRDQQRQLADLDLAFTNQYHIAENNAQIGVKFEQAYLATNKLLRKQKRRTVLVAIAGALATGATLYFTTR